MIGERREARTKNQAQYLTEMWILKGTANYLLCPLVFR